MSTGGIYTCFCFVIESGGCRDCHDLNDGDNTRQDFIYTRAVTQRHRKDIYISILLSTRDKTVDSKYINYNTNTYTDTYVSTYYVIIQIFNTDIRVSKYL